jgi:hypothetical protein
MVTPGGTGGKSHQASAAPTRNAKKTGNPPSFGTVPSWRRRPPGRATMPKRRDRRRAIGVPALATTNAATKTIR